MADGYYKGVVGGGLYVDSSAQYEAVLPAALPNPTSEGAAFDDLPVDTVNGAAVIGYAYPTYGLVIQQPQGGPEPASLGLLAARGAGLLLARRRVQR